MVKNMSIGPVGVKIFGSFQKIMMLPRLSFELATNTNRLLEVLQTPKKLLPSICQSRNFKCKAWAQDVKFLDLQIDSGNFWGAQSISKSKLVANSKLGRGSIMIFLMTQKIALLLLQ